MKSLILFMFITLFLHSPVTCLVFPQVGFIEEPREIEFYQPFNVYSQSSKSSTSLNPKSNSLNSLTKSAYSAHLKQFNQLLSLKEKIPNHLHLGLDNLASKLKMPSESIHLEFYPSVFSEGPEIQHSIKLAVYLLEMYNLTVQQRVWVLAVLQHLQFYLPKGGSKQMNTDMTQGPIRFAALQVHLTKGSDLLRASQILWKPPVCELKDVDLSLTEAFFRLRTLVEIKNQLKIHQVTNPSEFIKDIYDTSLQESLPIPDERLKTILMKCSKHLVSKDVETWEKDVSYNLMHRYTRINSRAKELIEVLKSEDNSFKWEFGRKDLLQELLYIFERKENSLRPFEKAFTLFLDQSWDLNIDTLKRTCKFMIDAKKENSKQEALSSELYSKNEDFAIRWLQKFSPYIDGAKSYLEEHVELSSNPQLFTFKTIGNCSICWEPMHLAEPLVNFEHGVDHRFHSACIAKVQRDASGAKLCPICRRVVEPKAVINRTQHRLSNPVHHFPRYTQYAP